MGREYQCAVCGGTFETDDEEWSEEDAIEEAVRLFGEDPRDGGTEIVCDDCFKAITQPRAFLRRWPEEHFP